VQVRQQWEKKRSRGQNNLPSPMRLEGYEGTKSLDARRFPDFSLDKSDEDAGEDTRSR
jgi:hypothetical protein